MYTDDIEDTNDLNRPTAGIPIRQRSTCRRTINAFLGLTDLK